MSPTSVSLPGSSPCSTTRKVERPPPLSMAKACKPFDTAPGSESGLPIGQALPSGEIRVSHRSELGLEKRTKVSLQELDSDGDDWRSVLSTIRPGHPGQQLAPRMIDGGRRRQHGLGSVPAPEDRSRPRMCSRGSPRPRPPPALPGRYSGSPRPWSPGAAPARKRYAATADARATVARSRFRRTWSRWEQKSPCRSGAAHAGALGIIPHALVKQDCPSRVRSGPTTSFLPSKFPAQPAPFFISGA